MHVISGLRVAAAAVCCLPRAEYKCRREGKADQGQPSYEIRFSLQKRLGPVAPLGMGKVTADAMESFLRVNRDQIDDRAHPLRMDHVNSAHD